jgi:hypothetical protein
VVFDKSLVYFSVYISSVTWPTILCNISKWRYFYAEHEWCLNILRLDHWFPSYLDKYVNMAAILDAILKITLFLSSDFVRFFVAYYAATNVPKSIKKPFVSIGLGLSAFFFIEWPVYIAYTQRNQSLCHQRLIKTRICYI